MPVIRKVAGRFSLMVERNRSHSQSGMRPCPWTKKTNKQTKKLTTNKNLCMFMEQSVLLPLESVVTSCLKSDYHYVLWPPSRFKLRFIYVLQDVNTGQCDTGMISWLIQGNVIPVLYASKYHKVRVINCTNTHKRGHGSIKSQKYTTPTNTTSMKQLVSLNARGPNRIYRYSLHKGNTIFIHKQTW